MGTGTSLRRISRAAALVAAGALGGGAAFAVASVPDSNGTFHACVSVVTRGTTTIPASGANVSVIDPNAGQQCNPTAGATPAQTEISWNATGPQGPPGASGAPGSPGAPGKIVTVAAGHTLTLAGGQVVTVGDSGPTITPPLLRSNAKPVGSVAIGTGSGALTFPLLSFGFAASRASTTRTQVNDITITKTVDKSSAKLFLACTNGKHFSSAKITLRKSGGGGGSSGKIYLVFSFKLVAVKTIQAEPSNGGGKPLESLTLSFSKETVETK
jgi:hypothetical protein